MNDCKISLYSIERIQVKLNNTLKMYIPISGSINVKINNVSYTVEKNEILIVNPYEVAIIYPTAGKENNLIVDLEYSKDYLKSKGKYKINYYNYIDKSYSDKFLLENVFNIFENKNKDQKLYSYYIENFIDNLSTNNFIVNSLRKNKENDILDRFIRQREHDFDYIDKNLEEIAEILNVSSNYFSNVFKKKTGISLSMYKQIAKLPKASQLLIDTEQSMEEIAFNIGYLSSKSLYDIFSKHIDMLPSEYKLIFNSKKPLNKDNFELYNMAKEEVSNISYEEVYQKYGHYNSYSLRKDKSQGSFNFDGISIYSLNKLGSDYYDKIIEINNQIKINYLVIDISIDRDYEETIYINYMDKKISFNELLSLLELLTKLDIKVGLAVDIHKKEYGYYSLRDYRILESFMNSILTVVTRSICIEYDWIISLKTDRDVDLLEDYFRKRRKAVENVFGKDAKICLYLGDQNKDQLMENFSILNNQDLYKIRKVFFNIIYEEVIDPKDIKFKTELFGDFGRSIKEYYKEAYDIAQGYELVLCDMNIEYEDEYYSKVANDSFLYEHLKMAYLNFETMVGLGLNKMVYYQLKNISDGSIRKTELMDKGQFKTSLYFSLQLLNQFKGDIILNEAGCLATNHNDDFNILIHNNMLLDNNFAKKKNFSYLERFSRHIDLNISNLRGRYKVVTWIINLKNGNSSYIINDFNEDYYLTDDEINYVTNINSPRKKIDIINSIDNYTRKIKIEPYTIIFTSYYRI